MIDLETRGITLDGRGLVHRSAPITVRSATEAEAMSFEGIGVPWGEVIDHAFGTETFDRGSVSGDAVKLFAEHSELIGTVDSMDDRDDGCHITATIADTGRGRDTWSLIRAGALDRMSIGFEPIEWRVDEDDVLHWTKVRAREFSVVAFPAYSHTPIATPPNRSARKESTMDTITRADLDPINASLDELTRKVALFGTDRPGPTRRDQRTAGEFLKALVAGDDEARDAYNRVYDGSKVGDDPNHPTFVDNLVRLVNDANPVGGLFNTEPLPATGMTVDYEKLKSNTITVAKQENEGDDLRMGTVLFEDGSAKVYTFGGASRVSRQRIERSQAPVLTTIMNAFALAAGKAQAAETVSVVTATIAEQTSAKNTVTVSDFTDWTAWTKGVISAVQKFTNVVGLPVDGILADDDTFTKIATMKDTANRPLMDVRADGTNTVGNMTVRTLQGNILSIPVFLFPGAESGKACFFNREAVTTWANPLVSLQDENILNLSKDFSVYRYAAVGATIPQAIVPIVTTQAG